MKTKASLLFFLVIICMSCKDEEYTHLRWNPKHTFDIGWEDYTLETSLLAASKTEWEISFENPVDWCSVSIQSGKGEQDILLTIDKNMTTEQRQVIVYARNINDTKERAILRITQDKNPEELSVFPTSFHQDASAADCLINVTSSFEDWTVEVRYVPEVWEKYPWCTLSATTGTYSDDVVVNIKENPTEAKRGAIITFRSGDIAVIDTIIQSAKYLPDEVGVEINGVTWATKNVGDYGIFASYAGGDYGKYYQFSNWVSFPNENIQIGENPNEAWVRRSRAISWSSLDDPSPEGWRIPTKEELDALVKSGYRWVKQEDSYLGCAGAWAGPNAEFATFDNPGEAIFFPALGIMSTYESIIAFFYNQGIYHAEGRLALGNSHILRVYSGGFSSPLNRAIDFHAACSIRCVKK